MLNLQINIALNTHLYINLYPSMFFLGARGILEHWRNGQKLQTIVDDNPYNYDYPVFHE